PGPALLREHGDDAHRILVVGDGAGQHGPDAASDRVRAELWPAVVPLQILGPDQLLLLKGRDARPLLVADLDLFQVAHAVIGYGRVQQVVVDVGQHQAGSVHGEDGVRGLDNLMHGVLDTHLAEAQPAEFVQRMTYVVYRDAHLPASSLPASSWAASS